MLNSPSTDCEIRPVDWSFVVSSRIDVESGLAMLGNGEISLKTQRG